MIPNFVSPHCHVNSIDSASTPANFIEREIELGTGHLTVTDHGTLATCRKVYDLAKKKKIKPILGLEGYFFDAGDEVLKKHGIEDIKKYVGNYYHITLHFRDQIAYETACRLISDADDRAIVAYGERKPPFTWRDLEELGATNTTVGTGCFGGMVQEHIAKHRRPDIAMAYYDKLRSIFKPGNLIAELFPHRLTHEWDDAVYLTFADGETQKFRTTKNLLVDLGKGPVKMHAEDLVRQFKKGSPVVGALLGTMENRVMIDLPAPRAFVGIKRNTGFVPNECCELAPDGDLQWASNRFVSMLAKRNGDPILVSDDAHFAHADEKIIQDIRLSSFGREWKFYGSYHRQSSEEAFAYFNSRMNTPEAEFQKWVENSYEWAAKFDDFKFVDRKTLPTKFYPEDTMSHIAKLIKEQGRMEWTNPQYVSRLKSEMKLLHQSGIDLLPYFFAAQESVGIYEKAMQLTGPGRGSAAGLLTSYLLGITHVDPLPFDLSQDRFLTADRIASGKLPDIDQDLGNRDLLEGWEEQRLELTMENGEKIVIGVDEKVKTPSGYVEAHRALREGLDVEF